MRHLLSILIFWPVLSTFVNTASAIQTPSPPDSFAGKLAAESQTELTKKVLSNGDAQRGAMLYYDPVLNCVKCHEPADDAPRLGPAIHEVNVDATTAYLMNSLLTPSSHLTKGFQLETVLTVDGDLVQGLVHSETNDQLVLVDPALDGKQTTILIDDIEDRKPQTVSAMPDGLVNLLGDRQQFFDLIKYLHEIKRGGAGAVLKLRPPESFFAVAPLPEYEAQIDHSALIRKLDPKSIERGSEIYMRYCERCHGTKENEGSMPSALRFADGKFKNGSDPHSMYKTLTHGYGLMVAQRWMVPKQKYDVIAYIHNEFVSDSKVTEPFSPTDDYLAGLPQGDQLGPEPVLSKPWSDMDYGHSLLNTYEVGKGGSNIAYKGLAIRLDDGPGGVSQGKHWMMYEHDTMRVAAAWSGTGFIDWNGIHFNDRHQVHPRVVGDVLFQTPTGPGWADPATGLFTDDQRVVGRDRRRYGPLPESWMKYRGHYQFGYRTIVDYTVGATSVLESPSIEYTDRHSSVFVRTLNLGPRSQDLVLKLASVSNPERVRDNVSEQTLCLTSSSGLFWAVVAGIENPNWKVIDGAACLEIPKGAQSLKIAIGCGASKNGSKSLDDATQMADRFRSKKIVDLRPLTMGGQKRYPDVLASKLQKGADRGPFSVDVLTRPTQNPWAARLRLTGLDFVDKDTAVVSSWDGSVWRVSGFATDQGLSWRRIASGLFQPLGIKIVEQTIYVSCRDQIVELQDINGDGETDFYRCFNSDHQVTEHFHEFAMGLQTDEKGNFYYAKSARHAKPALVPHHGTLLKVDSTGRSTEIVARGFRAANGVCVNEDGSFFVTDQEGHWNPKNRINWVERGGFYGNMMGYHDVTDESDDAMQQPLCWITNAFDRSPGELMWVDSKKWGPLNGALLNLSYGAGQIFLVPHESVEFKGKPQLQGGMCSLPLKNFPTGIMRGRFNPHDGQLYVCGMYAWAGNQQQPGGLYRVRYTGKPVHLPLVVSTSENTVRIRFTEELDPNASSELDRLEVKQWDIKRTSNYGSPHLDEQRVKVVESRLLDDRKTVELTIPELRPTKCMEIKYRFKTSSGTEFRGKIHNTIHKLGNSAVKSTFGGSN